MNTSCTSSERGTGSLLAREIIFRNRINSLDVDVPQPGSHHLPQSDLLRLAAKHRSRCVPVTGKQEPAGWAVWDKQGNGTVECPSFCQSDDATSPGESERLALQRKIAGVGGELADVQLSRYDEER